MKCIHTYINVHDLDHIYNSKACHKLIHHLSPDEGVISFLIKPLKSVWCINSFFGTKYQEYSHALGKYNHSYINVVQVAGIIRYSYLEYMQLSNCLNNNWS